MRICQRCKKKIKIKILTFASLHVKLKTSPTLTPCGWGSHYFPVDREPCDQGPYYHLVDKPKPTDVVEDANLRNESKTIPVSEFPLLEHHDVTHLMQRDCCRFDSSAQKWIRPSSFNRLSSSHPKGEFLLPQLVLSLVDFNLGFDIWLGLWIWPGNRPLRPSRFIEAWIRKALT